MIKDRLNINNKTVIFTGGGTGGHIWPLVSIMAYARDQLGVRPVYFGPIGPLEQRAIVGNGFNAVKIPSGKRRNYRSVKNLFDYVILGYGLTKALIWLMVVRPAIVFGKGGYGMLPTIMAAKRLGIRVVSHDSDIVIGRASNFVLDRDNILLTAFPVDQYDFDTRKTPFVRYTGMPVHPGFYAGLLKGMEKYTHLPKELTKDKVSVAAGKYIVVFGGSQGAVRLNRAVLSAWTGLTQYGHIVHITGQIDYEFMNQKWSELEPAIKAKIHLLPETDNLPAIISRAGVAITRAGATSLWELVAAGVPTIAVPLPEAAADHQRLNALWMSQEFPGLVQTLEEKNFSSDKLISRVKQVIVKPKLNPSRDRLLMPRDALTNIGQIILEGLTENYFRSKRNFHLVGIKGVSMAGIAKVLKKMGHTVTGSDQSTGGHDAGNIKNNLDAVVYTSAVLNPKAPGQVEIDAAKAKSIPVIKRSLFIADLVNIKRVIATSGMHGKSTTASMLAHILKRAEMDPTYFIGVPEDEQVRLVKAAEYGRGNVAVIEACEYDRSFYDFHADTIIVTNIEPEHLDYFTGGLPEIEKTFVDFISLARPAANVIIPKAMTSSIKRVLAKINKARPDIGVLQVEAPKVPVNKQFHFFGQHILLDAALAVHAAQILNIMEDDAWQYLEDFPGAKRRMEFVGQCGQAMIFDDYGHHPTEIAAVIKSFREKYPGRRLILVFQPHQYSRTKMLFKDFVDALAMADKVIITDIYEVAGREQTKDVSSQDLVAAINAKYGHERADYEAMPYDGITARLRDILSGRDIVITMGATDIYKVAEELKQ